MTWVQSLQVAIDYMEDHLLEELSVESIAKEANFSSFHFQRVFSVLTDMSVGEYLRRRRLTLAAHELTRENTKVIDIAYKYGYETPEAFSKAFRKHHGISPTKARAYKGKLTSYNRLVIQVSLKGAEPMNVKMVEKEAFDVVGVNETFSLENGENFKEIPKRWDRLINEGTTDQLFALNDGPIAGLLGLCVGKNEKSVEYWIGTASGAGRSDSFNHIQIPASTWAVFEVHGPMPGAMQAVWKKIYSEWLPSSGYEHTGTPELEVYSKDDPYREDLYSEIWVPVK
ncbi:AraC family transcriptional regulator [Geomicrobium sp. JCM 19039]|uniref:AraC family transcriptional regulator n=1 Tax=Geomicrobium sp. JCM 19039 TaxID=1460636 RepID=UPI00045F436B|nr:AraC family transcriptional regulator [Geomicrobium sp. JCM 19039]GAK14142.1 transcriptional regulatory protein [Geomicrobium sp. JCM 19039]